MTKKALVLGSGALNGAYSAGFVSELCRMLGPNYFDSVYCYSVGTTIGSFYVANQPEIIENTWKNYIDGTKLIKPYNFFIKKPILDLDYLISLFKSDISKLDVDAITHSKTDLNYVLVDYNSGEVLFLRPAKDNIFDLIKAACSLPIVYGPTRVGDRLFFDATFVAGGLPFLEKIVEKHDETTIVLNFSKDYKPKPIWRPIINLLFPLISFFYPKPLRKVFKHKKEEYKKFLDYVENNKKIELITPSKPVILYSGSDFNAERIKKYFDLGKQDAKIFITKIRNS